MKPWIELFAVYILKVIMRAFLLFPLRNRVLFCSYNGEGYSGNPKYLFEHLLSIKPSGMQTVWAFKTPEKFKSLSNNNVKLIKYQSIVYYYYYSTSKIVISNLPPHSYAIKRKNQFIVDTWHGGMDIKKCGICENGLSYAKIQRLKLQTENTDILISPGEIFDKYTAEMDLGFTKEILKIGYPRNDILFRQMEGNINLKRLICAKYGIMESDYLVLYAPTWRKGNGFRYKDFPTAKICSILEKKLNRKALILYRTHRKAKDLVYNDSNCIDVSDYPDMQELLGAADCLITDYSSAIWDYAILGKPVFLFAPDIKEYESERGLHIDIKEMGFPYSENPEELLENVEKNCDKDFRETCHAFFEKYKSYENGNACSEFWNNILYMGR